MTKSARLVAERCPAYPNALADLPLRAAVMLHWDRDRAQQPSPEGVERQRRCPGPLARLAGHAGRRQERDPYWDYLVVNAEDLTGPARGPAQGVPGVSGGRRALVALAFAVLARTGHAQSPQKPIEFRSQVAAVNVDAFVTRGDQPVPGLRAADFELRDNGAAL